MIWIGVGLAIAGFFVGLGLENAAKIIASGVIVKDCDEKIRKVVADA